MEHNQNMHSAIYMLSLLKGAKIHRVMLDENNSDKFMLGVSGTNRPFHLIENWGDKAREKEEIRFFSDNLSMQYPALKPTLDVVVNDSVVPTYTDLRLVVTNTMVNNGINPEECVNKDIYSNTLSVGYSQDGWDHDTTISNAEFFETYSVAGDATLDANA